MKNVNQTTFIVIVVILLALIGILGFAIYAETQIEYSQYNSLQSQYNNLQNQYTVLQSQLDALLGSAQTKSVTIEISANSTNDPYLRCDLFNIDKTLTPYEINNDGVGADYAFNDLGSANHVVTINLTPGTHFICFTVSASPPYYWSGNITINGQVIASSNDLTTTNTITAYFVV
jgi:hypothetical protein